MKGVMFGDKHSYRDFGLILSSKSISPPKAQINMVSVPLRDGSIDLTESLTGDVKYEDREISITFTVINHNNAWAATISEVENYLHGQRMQIVFDDDASFYYIGRISVNKFTSKKNLGTLVIDCTVEPYKYDVLSTLDDWEWDSFDFDTGRINQISDISVEGSTEVIVIGRRKKVSPKITTSAAMTVAFEGAEYNLSAGTQKVYGLLLHEGENVLTFTGKGTVSVDYRGGSL